MANGECFQAIRTFLLNPSTSHQGRREVAQTVQRDQRRDHVGGHQSVSYRFTTTPSTWRYLSEEAKRSERLMATMDKLNRELGKGKVQLGLPRKGNAWALRG